MKFWANFFMYLMFASLIGAVVCTLFGMIFNNPMPAFCCLVLAACGMIGNDIAMKIWLNQIVEENKKNHEEDAAE